MSPVPERVLEFDNFMDRRRETITRRAKYAVWMDWSFSRANVVLYSFRFSHGSVLRCYWSVSHQAQVHSQTHSKADKLVLCNAVLACRNRGGYRYNWTLFGEWLKIKVGKNQGSKHVYHHALSFLPHLDCVIIKPQGLTKSSFYMWWCEL